MPSLLLIVLGPVLLTLGYIFLPWVTKSICRRFPHRPHGPSTLVALTFDDGPDPRTTPSILDILATYDMKATFFVIGERAERESELVRSIAAGGHEVGLHGHRHLHGWLTGPKPTVKDLFAGIRVLEDLIPASPVRHYRPPFGKQNLLTAALLRCMGLKVAYWDVDPRDYDGHCPEEVSDRVHEQLRPGSVILLHDGTVDKPRKPEAVVEATRSVVRSIQREGLTSVTLTELTKGFHDYGVTRMPTLREQGFS